MNSMMLGIPKLIDYGYKFFLPLIICDSCSSILAN